MPPRSSSPSPHLRFTVTIILNLQVRYKSSVRVVRVVVVLFFASTRTLRSSPRKPSYTHFEQGRDDPSPQPHRHVSHRSGSYATTLRRRSFLVHFTSYHYQRQLRSRRTPMPLPRLCTLHPTPSPGSAHPFAEPAPITPPQPRTSRHPRAPALAPPQLPKLRVVRYACDVYHRQTDEVELSGCGRVNRTGETRVSCVCRFF